MIKTIKNDGFGSTFGGYAYVTLILEGDWGSFKDETHTSTTLTLNLTRELKRIHHKYSSSKFCTIISIYNIRIQTTYFLNINNNYQNKNNN